MKILLVTSSFHPVIGGAETYALTVAKGLTAAGHEVRLLTDGYRAGREAVDDFPFRVLRPRQYRHRIDDPSKLPWEEMAFSLLPEFQQLLEGWEPDVVLTNSLDAAIFGAMVASQYSVPMVATMHEQEPEADPFGGGKCRFVYEVIGPDAVLAGSQHYAARARAFGTPPERLHVIHHGIDTEVFSPMTPGASVRSRLGLGADDLLIACAARLKERKGVEPLVSAFLQIATDRSNFHLLLCGSVSSASMEYADRVRAQVEGSGGRVTLWEDVTHDEVPAVFAAADVVAQPSLAEGLGLAVLEAMASGTAVVTTDIDGVREVATGEQHGALIVPPSDVPSLAAALVRLLEDRELRSALGRRGRERVEQHFSITAMVDRTEDVLREVCC